MEAYPIHKRMRKSSLNIIHMPCGWSIVIRRVVACQKVILWKAYKLVRPEWHDTADINYYIAANHRICRVHDWIGAIVSGKFLFDLVVKPEWNPSRISSLNENFIDLVSLLVRFIFKPSPARSNKTKQIKAISKKGRIPGIIKGHWFLYWSIIWLTRDSFIQLLWLFIIQALCIFVAPRPYPHELFSFASLYPS